MNVQPFHVMIKGLEKTILCRDSEDYDMFVKHIAICAWRKNVIVVIYTVVSNHCHVAVLAASQKDAEDYANELKRSYSQWFRAKYGEQKVLKGVDSRAICLDNDWYVRNALAYIPRNALDNGCPVHEYEWSGFRSMFSKSEVPSECKPVSSMTKREVNRVFHTRDNLSCVPWLIDACNRIVPGSFCDTGYLEQVFNNDQSFFLKTIGAANVGEMEEKLVYGPRRMLPDSEFLKIVEEISGRWFNLSVSSLSVEKKKRLLPYVWRTHKTTISQLSRAFGLEKEQVELVLKP